MSRGKFWILEEAKALITNARQSKDLTPYEDHKLTGQAIDSVISKIDSSEDFVYVSQDGNEDYNLTFTKEIYDEVELTVYIANSTLNGMSREAKQLYNAANSPDEDCINLQFEGADNIEGNSEDGFIRDDFFMDHNLSGSDIWKKIEINRYVS